MRGQACNTMAITGTSAQIHFLMRTTSVPAVLLPRWESSMIQTAFPFETHVGINVFPK